MAIITCTTGFLAPALLGSAMKPINVYAPAIEEGLITPATAIDDAPTAWQTHDRYYTPENFNQSFSGLTTVRDALIRSLNVPAVKVYNDKLGKETGINYAKSFGITTLTESDKHNAAAAIGGLRRGVSPFEITQAYGVLANEGNRIDHHTISKIEDRDGNIIYEHDNESSEIISKETAWLINNILEDVVAEGTAASLEVDFPVAAKTGTSDNLRDAWLIGHTPDLVATFWLGYDRGNIQVKNRTDYTTRVIENILNTVLEDNNNPGFERPENIEGPVAVSTKSGLLPGNNTPDRYITTDYFPKDMVPSETCNMFVAREICTVHDNKVLSGDNCPEEITSTQIFLNRSYPGTTDDRWKGAPGRTTQDAYLMPPSDRCNLSTGEHIPGDREKQENNDKENDEDENGDDEDEYENG